MDGHPAGGHRPGVGLHLNDLRHTGNPLVDPSLKERVTRMGHSTVRAALIYQHADRGRERQIADRPSDAIEAAKPASNGHVAGTDGQDGER